MAAETARRLGLRTNSPEALAAAQDKYRQRQAAAAAGQRVVALPAGDRYLGFVFARAGSADEVEAALRAAWSTLAVDVTTW